MPQGWSILLLLGDTILLCLLQQRYYVRLPWMWCWSHVRYLGLSTTLWATEPRLSAQMAAMETQIPISKGTGDGLGGVRLAVGGGLGGHFSFCQGTGDGLGGVRLAVGGGLGGHFSSCLKWHLPLLLPLGRLPGRHMHKVHLTKPS